MPTNQYEVVFSTTIYNSAFVYADSIEEAEAKALDSHYPKLIQIPYGFEMDSDEWIIEGTTRIRDED